MSARPGLHTLRATCLVSVLLLACAVGWADGAASAPSAAGSREALGIDDAALASASFDAGVPEPGWADPPSAPPADASPGSDAASVRVADTQIHPGPPLTVLMRRVIEALDTQGLAQIGHVRVDFQPRHQRMHLHRLQIERDGRFIDHTRTAAVRFLQREQGLESGGYSGVVTVSILLPDVRVGDRLHVSVSTVGTHPVLGPRLSQRVRWDSDHPVGWRRVTLLEPAGLALRWQWMGGGGPAPVPAVEHGADGSRRLRFGAAALPATVHEPHAPAEAEPARWLQISGYGSWNEVARWAAALFPPDVPLTGDGAALVARLRALPDPQDRVVQALHWVQSEIRNWSVALGDGSHRPRLPDEVLQRRYGDCKDKSWLLVRLLAALGIEAQPVLASAAAPRGPAAWLPSPGAFDHVIVRVRLDGRDHFVDPTRPPQVGRLERLGQAFEEAAVLPVDAGAQGLITVRSPNRDQIFAHAVTERLRLDRFDAEGTLQTEVQWTGAAAEFVRAAARRIDAARWRQTLLADYTPRYPAIRLVGDPELLDDTELNVVRLRALFGVPGLARPVGDGAWSVRYVPAVLGGGLVLPGGAPRRFPIALPGYPYRRSYEVEMTWPAIVDAAHVPQDERLRTPHFEFEAGSRFVGAVQRHTLSLRPLVPAVPVAELATYVGDVDTMASRLTQELVVRDADCGGDCTPAPATGN